MTSIEQKPQESDPAELFEGAGIFSSAADLGSAMASEHADGGEIAADSVGVGLDVLGVAMDPLGSLAEAGVGWLIEHVSFLREPLDQLCGDPKQIEQRAKDWQQLSRTLVEQSTAFGEAARGDLTGWAGDAAAAYRGAAGTYRDSIGSCAQNAASVSQVVLQSGVMVGTVRSLIRDEIATWVVMLGEWAAEALFTAGLATPVIIAQAVERAVEMGRRFVKMMEKLVEALEKAGEILARVGREIGELAGALPKNAGREAGGFGLGPVRSAAAGEGRAGAQAVESASEPVAVTESGQRWVDNARAVRADLQKRSGLPAPRSKHELAGTVPDAELAGGPALLQPNWAHRIEEGHDDALWVGEHVAATGVEVGKGEGKARENRSEWTAEGSAD